MQLQEKFYRQVVNLPPVVSFSVVTVAKKSTANADLDDYDNFVGDNDRTPVTHTIKCLYKREISVWERKKIGIDEDVAAIIYVPPKVLIEKFGTFKLDYKKILVTFTDYNNNDEYVVDRVVYQEPHYDSCIAVQYHIKSADKV